MRYIFNVRNDAELIPALRALRTVLDHSMSYPDSREIVVVVAKKDAFLVRLNKSSISVFSE